MKIYIVACLSYQIQADLFLSMIKFSLCKHIYSIRSPVRLLTVRFSGVCRSLSIHIPAMKRNSELEQQLLQLAQNSGNEKLTHKAS